MKLWMKAAIGVVVLAGAAGGGFMFMRGRTGATTAIGGDLEAMVMPEFKSLDAARWVNGAPAPLAGLRGEVVLIEAWAPG